MTSQVPPTTPPHGARAENSKYSPLSTARMNGGITTVPLGGSAGVGKIFVGSGGGAGPKTERGGGSGSGEEEGTIDLPLASSARFQSWYDEGADVLAKDGEEVMDTIDDGDVEARVGLEFDADSEVVRVVSHIPTPRGATPPPSEWVRAGDCRSRTVLCKILLRDVVGCELEVVSNNSPRKRPDRRPRRAKHLQEGDLSWCSATQSVSPLCSSSAGEMFFDEEEGDGLTSAESVESFHAPLSLLDELDGEPGHAASTSNPAVLREQAEQRVEQREEQINSLLAGTPATLTADASYKPRHAPKAYKPRPIMEALLRIYRYVKKEKGAAGSPRRASHVVLCGDTGDLRAVRCAVRCIRRLAGLGKVPQRAGGVRRYHRRALVVVNPHGGTAKAVEVWSTVVSPMFSEAGIETDLLVTKYAGHARDRMTWLGEKSKGGSPEKTGNAKANGGRGVSGMVIGASDSGTDVLSGVYDTLVVIGGDGMLHEILQGIRIRSHAEGALQGKNYDSTLITRFPPIGIIPAGTGNGLAKSISHENGEHHSALTSTFLICKGQVRTMDLATYQTSNVTYTGFLTYSWGLVADVDLESKRRRFLGSLRTDIHAVLKIISLPVYPARFSYIPVPPKNLEVALRDLVLPAPEEPLPREWTTIEDGLVLVWASQVTHAAHDIFLSPNSTSDDGIFQIIVIRGSCSRLKVAKIFMNLQSGKHIDSCDNEHVSIYKCIAFRLEPLKPASYNDVDGEKVEGGVIQAKVDPKRLKYFSLSQ